MSVKNKTFFVAAALSMAAMVSTVQAANPKYVIPTVVHVLYADSGVNDAVTNARIKAALARTNQLYRGTVTTPVSPGYLDTYVENYPSALGKLDIEFRLAKKSPNGAATTGINRVRASNRSWATTAKNYISSITSAYNWDTNKYLNIYIVDGIDGYGLTKGSAVGSGQSGIAWMPTDTGTLPSYNAVFVKAHVIGGYDANKPLWPDWEGVLAHEIGHAMNLRHTFGHNGYVGTTCGDDGIADTPATWGWYHATEMQTWSAAEATWNDAPGALLSCASKKTIQLDNFENVMDYTRVQLMFTAGQMKRVETTLNTSTWGRNKLWAASNLIATGTDVP